MEGSGGTRTSFLVVQELTFMLPLAAERSIFRQNGGLGVSALNCKKRTFETALQHMYIHLYKEIAVMLLSGPNLTI